METLISDGKVAQNINEKGDPASGGVGNGFVYGSNRKDVIFGDQGNDEIYGNEGDDILIGEDGTDRLFGWTGSDEWRFAA